MNWCDDDDDLARDVPSWYKNLKSLKNVFMKKTQ